MSDDLPLMTLRDPADRVRWWIAVALTAVVVGAVAVPVVTIVSTRERNAVSVADEIVVRIGARTSDLVTDQLQTATQSLELLRQLVDADIGEPTSIDRTLAAEVRAVPQLSGAFVGFPDGDFNFVRRDADVLTLKRIDTVPERSVTEATVDDHLQFGAPVEIDDAFDPRVRPWYRSAVDADGPVWTAPYIFFTAGTPGVTVATAIRDVEGSVAAVVGVDLALRQMSSFLDDLPLDDTAEVFIIADDAVVAAPSAYDLVRIDDAGDLMLPTPEQIGLTGRLHASRLDDPSLPGWTVVVRADELEFVDVVKGQSQVALVATIVAALALLAAIPLMLLRLRRPIDELSRRARFDPLTGLLNRSALFEEGQRVVRDAYKSGAEVTLAVVDVDDFKTINDRFGHAAGDDAIRRIGHALRTSVRPADHVGRLGGDEFVVIMSDLSSEDALTVLDRVRDTATIDVGTGPERRISSLTIGVAWLAGRALHIERLLAEADHALIEAKRHAKGTVASA